MNPREHFKLIDPALVILDQVFLAFFARRRRALGNDRIIDAWRRANHSVTLYFGFSLLALLFALIVTVNVVLELNVSRTYKLSWQIIAGAICVIASLLLERRFGKFLTMPPRLLNEESPSESSLIRWYRIATVGTFITACFGAYLLSQAGLGF